MRRFLLTLILSFTLLTGLTNAIAVGETATFRANSDGASSYEWTFPGGVTKTGNIVEHRFDQSGQFSVTLKVTGNDGQTNQVTKSITVQNGDRPTAIIKATLEGQVRAGSEVVIKRGDQITLEPNFDNQDKNELNVVWSINGQRFDGNKITSSAFDRIGAYQVRLTVSDKDQSFLRDESQILVTVENQPPEVSSMSVNADKNGQAVRVRANASDPDGTIESYRFEVLERGRSVLSQVVNQAETSFNLSQFPGTHTYNFRVTVSDDRQRTTRYDHSESLTLTNEIENNPPELNLVIAPGNEGSTEDWFNFLADASDPDGDALRYQWLFPDGQQYFSNQVRYRFTKGGPQNITVRVTDGIETLEESIEINIIAPPNEPPSVKIMSVLPGPTGDTNTLFRLNSLGTDVDRDNLIYSWDMGDGGQAIGNSPIYRYTEPGTYTATVTVSDGLAENTDQTQLQVAAAPVPPNQDPANNQAPTVNITAINSTGSLGDNFRFTSEVADRDSDPLTYVWDMGDDIRYFTPQASHFYRTPGNYSVSLTVSDGMTETTATTNVTVEDDGTVDPGAETNNQAPQVRILSVGPQLTGTPDTIFRFYTQGQDTDGDQLTYLWDMGDGQQMFIQNPAYRYAEAGQYQVQVRASDGLREATDQITINVQEADLRGSATDPTADPENEPENQPPTLGITAVAPSTKGFTTTLFRFFSQVNDPEGLPLEFSWDMGDGNTVTGQNPIYRYDLPGTYLVKASVSDGELTSEAEVTVTVEEKELILNDPENNEPPTLSLESFPLIGDLGTMFRFVTQSEDPNGDQILYHWDMGDGNQYFTESVKHQYKTVGEYEVAVEATDGLGKSVTSQLIVVNEGGFAPSLFTEQRDTSLGVIDQAEFGARSCSLFLTQLQRPARTENIDFVAAKIALRSKADELRMALQDESLSDVKRQPLQSELTIAKTNLQYIEKWSNQSMAAQQPLANLQASLTENEWNELLEFGLKPTETLRLAQIRVLQKLQSLVEAYRISQDTVEKLNLRRQMEAAVAINKRLNPWYDLSNDKSTLTEKKERLKAINEKLTEEVYFATDKEQQANMEEALQVNQRLVQIIEKIEAQVLDHFMNEAQAEVRRCQASDLTAEELAAFKNIDLSALNINQLIDALADFEGTIDTTFFLYAKASEAYRENALLFEWDLGDGRQSGGQNIYLKYPRPGLYEIELKISDELTSSRDRLRIRVYESWPKKD